MTRSGYSEKPIGQDEVGEHNENRIWLSKDNKVKGKRKIQFEEKYREEKKLKGHVRDIERLTEFGLKTSEFVE